MLLSAIWLGLSFANLLVAPIRRLIDATDQVSSGNLYVQVPIRRSEGDLARLGETFNKMISELRLQQNRLIAARETIDARRLFTEAVLSGVPAAVIGVDARGDVTVLNASAQKLLDIADPDGTPAVGRSLAAAVPELAAILSETRNGRQRLQQGQVTLARAGGSGPSTSASPASCRGKAERNSVVTLDDITDLVAAQRTSAWADVARRIAHEIKNPLTPIQLSAERLKRRYSKVITEGRDVFDQCTDTIIRQVDDMKRMVDEFSSFARMPKALLAEDDLAKCVGQVAFLMRVGQPRDRPGRGPADGAAGGALRPAAPVPGADQHRQERHRGRRRPHGVAAARRAGPGAHRRVAAPRRRRPGRHRRRPTTARGSPPRTASACWSPT